MRLTLRTLLAWMDGVLPADLEQEMAAKVSATPLAQGLADRIRDVSSRPTLPAPAVDGRGFAADPNSAAEYLDNVLHGERLGDFERICIESDMQLAEVGGCHRLLAELAREPAPASNIPPAVRHRLVEAARNPATVQPTVGDDAAAASAPWPANGRPVGRRGVRPATQQKADGRAPLAAWLMAIAAVLLLGVLVGFLGWSLGRSRARVAPAVAAGKPDAKPGPREPAQPDERKPQPAAQAPIAVPPAMQAPAAAPPAAEPQAAAPPAASGLT